MKKIYLLLVTGLAMFSGMAQTSGGPDAYGYEWRNSNDAQGPTYNWIDITTTGTQVAGLTDDNSIAFVPMGMNFHYYWVDYNQIKIGSNGWLSFNNVANIAHCFPTIPTAGGAGDNILAPLMSDLIMNAAGASAEVWYYHDAVNEQFIVSYINVPWWSASAPGYIGNNTFQVILSNQDSSITFQYQQSDQANKPDVGGCAADVEVGIENVTGNIGLEVYNEAMPANNEAIKFYYPDTVLIAVPDATPLWAQNVDNQATFHLTGSNISLPVEIASVGNADISGSITVEMTIRDLALTQQFFKDTLISALTAGSSQNIVFDVPPLAAGQYSVEVITTNGSDINPSNNSLTTEIEVVDATQPSVVLSYATQNAPDGSISWNGGGSNGEGVAVHIIPPAYPTTLESVDMYIQQAAFELANQSAYTVEVLADDGAGNIPGTLLATETEAQGSYTPGNWVNTTLSTPVVINSGGIYIAWKMGGDSVAVGTETFGPISRRTYEFLGGSYSPYRNSTVEDFLINGNFKDFTVGLSEANTLGEVRVYPNPNKGIFTIDATSFNETVNVNVLSILGQEVESLSVKKGQKSMIDLSQANKGIYFVQLSTSKGTRTERVVIY